MEHFNVSNVEAKMALRLISILLLLLISFKSKAQSLEFKYSDLGFKFWESLPENYDTSKKYPLIVFLHGRGERGDGTENSSQNALTWGPLRHINHGRFKQFTYEEEKYSFIVIAPQIDKPLTIWDPALVDQVINYAITNYPVDIRRVYLTGLSMGGNGTWVYAYSDYNSPNKLAAIATISAWGNIEKSCKVALRKIPVWAFHGIDDNTVDFERGKSVFQAAKNCIENNEPEMIFTAYENTKHDAWQKAYDVRNEWHTPNIYQWMLSHSLPSEKVKQIANDISLRTSTPEKTSESRLTLINKLPASLEESSGLVFDSQGNIWMLNDSGKGPFIFKLDTLGNILEFKKITHATNFDWEDMAIDSQNNLYIADIGNNENSRKKLMVYKVNLNDTSSRLPATTISYSYEDQVEFPPPPDQMNFDAESIILMRDSLYIFTKNRTEPFDGIVNIYQIPAKEGEYSAKLIDKLQLGSGAMLDNWITSASLSNDKKHLVLLSHSKLWLISCFEKNHFSSGIINEISLGSFSQKEGVTFYKNKQLYISDENYRKLIGGNLYKMDLSKLMLPCQNY